MDGSPWICDASAMPQGSRIPGSRGSRDPGDPGRRDGSWIGCDLLDMKREKKDYFVLF